jgi:hypothetical protein
MLDVLAQVLVVRDFHVLFLLRVGTSTVARDLLTLGVRRDGKVNGAPTWEDGRAV